MKADQFRPSRNFSVYLENGQRVELVDSETLCRFLGISKPKTLLDMANRGDLPQPIYLNMNLKGQRGRNQVRWNFPVVLQYIGVTKR